jgi:hypothetical protein
MSGDLTRPALSTAARRLAAYLHRHARGAARAVPYRTLVGMLRRAGCHVTDRDIYDLVAELQLAGRPVGSTPRRPRPGAFICVDDDDYEVTVANLRGRIIRPLRRLSRVQRTRREALTGQGVMDLEQEAPALVGKNGQRPIFNPSGRGRGGAI